jgi:hypothetical protein
MKTSLLDSTLIYGRKNGFAWRLSFSEQLFASVRDCVDEKRHMVFVIVRLNESPALAPPTNNPFLQFFNKEISSLIGGSLGS